MSTRCAARSARVKANKVRDRELEEVREPYPDGRIVLHHRTVDSLGKMLRSGTISPEMHDAARDFQAAFVIAQFDPLRAIPIMRVPGTAREPELNERQLAARQRVHRALEALGGISSPPARACGTSWDCSGAFASGRCAAAGMGGQCVRSRRRAS
jgi:hypothetical protein